MIFSPPKRQESSLNTTASLEGFTAIRQLRRPCSCSGGGGEGEERNARPDPICGLLCEFFGGRRIKKEGN